MESLLKDTPNKGHHRKYLSTKDTFGGTKMGYPMVVIHFYIRRVDNLSTVDKLAVPNVSFIQRFHCSTLCLPNLVCIMSHVGSLQ